MKKRPCWFLIVLGIASFSGFATGQEAGNKLVTPNPSSEALALLDYLYSISGKHTLAGQHNVPLLGSNSASVAYRHTKHYPAVFGQDFGFSPPGTWDGINFRQHIVDKRFAGMKRVLLLRSCGTPCGPSTTSR